jgi:uncharacterized protein YjbI with pentapeptide repeats
LGGVDELTATLRHKAGHLYRAECDPVANDEHLALLRRGAAIWNEWRARNPDTTPDLGGADLSKADLRRADLRDADLREADLKEADLREVRLSLANLRGADLRGANLDRANCRGADLGGGTNLCGTTLSWVNFHQANLPEAKLREAYLGWANISKANLRGADFSGAKLVETIIGDVDLTETLALSECSHSGPSVLDFRTLYQSKNLPISFLRGCGLPDNLIDYLPSLHGKAIQFYSCFISYSARDKVFAERLHADLQNKGVRCWFAPHDLPIGAKTWDAIDEAIRLRDKLLVILSKASLDSDWVEDEVTKAYAEERSRKGVVLFPIRIDNTVTATVEPWAVKLRNQRNIGDFRQWKKPAEYHKSLEQLLRDLKASGP